MSIVCVDIFSMICLYVSVESEAFLRVGADTFFQARLVPLRRRSVWLELKETVYLPAEIVARLKGLLLVIIGYSCVSQASRTQRKMGSVLFR